MAAADEIRAWLSVPPLERIAVALPDLLGRDQRFILDEDAARLLRDQLDDCLTGLTARRMAARWLVAA